MWAGYLGAALLWYVCVRWAPFEAFRRLPDPLAVLTEWLSPEPTYGISIFTPAYYKHMLYSMLRASVAFLAATAPMPFSSAAMRSSNTATVGFMMRE